MANASRDANRITTLLAVSNADGVTALPVYVDSATNRLLVNASISGSITASPASNGATGSAVPAQADYAGLNVAGTLRGATGVNPSGSIYATQVDIASVAGTTVATGNGTASGALRVAIASDNTAFSVNATLVAETTKVIGTVRTLGNSGAVLDGVVTAAASPANGFMGLGIYNSTEPSPTTGQSVGIQLDSKGRQRMVIMDAAGNTRGVNVDASNRMSVSVDAFTATNASTNIAQMNGVTVTMGNGVSGTGVQRVAIASDNSAVSGLGAGATGSAVPANAIYEGGNAITSLPTAATAGNTTGISVDKFGRQVVLPITIRDLTGTQTTTISASTSETTIVTAAASVFNDLVMLVVSNTSASTNTRIDFRDTTAGSVLFSLQSPGNTTIGFAPPIPIPQTSVNTNWTAQCATSTTDVRIYAVFAKNK